MIASKPHAFSSLPTASSNTSYFFSGPSSSTYLLNVISQSIILSPYLNNEQAHAVPGFEYHLETQNLKPLYLVPTPLT